MSFQSLNSQPGSDSAKAALQTLAGLAPVKTYVGLRDELWNELTERATFAITRYEIGVLELANRVVKVLLQNDRRNGDIGLTNALEILRCKVCETFVARVQAEIECQRPRTDIQFVRRSLQLASIDAPDLVQATSDGYGG